MATRSPTAPAIVFVVPGQRAASRSADGGPEQRSASGISGTVKDHVRIAAHRGGGDGVGANAVRVSAVPGEDVVVLHIADGPALVLHPENARDLMLGQGTLQRSATGAAPGEVQVPAQLRWRGLEQAAPTRSRGFLGDVLLQAFEVITGVGKDTATKFVASQVVAKVDGQVDPGVYQLHAERLLPLKGSGDKLVNVPSAPQPEQQPLLVLLHGTFVDTTSTFSKLWALHPQQVRELFNHYGGRVYALDHPTLGVSPLANALMLVQALPTNARLHLATHSRGGLVAEVLALVAGRMAQGGQLLPADLAFFADDHYAQHRKDLVALAAAVKARNIRVDRVVRVACPARGTLLASKRLDAYLSVLKWTIEVAGVPVVPALVDFLAEVARRRANPAELPGLESMIPDTPLVDWLNSSEDAIPGELRVVAGDLQGDSLGSWLKTLLADAYYWTDNDIVVQTRSMYGGSPRAGGASFLLDQGGKSTHFNYFANERSVTALVAGLTQAAPAGFRTIGPLSWAGQDSSGSRAARRSAESGQPASARPAVFVLPGILGSHLKAGDKRIWLSLRLIGGLGKLQYRSDDNSVKSDGPIGMVYDDLIDHLANTHEVLPFGFDWRRPIEEEAQRLADAVDQALDARNASGQPVRILAHSMGGVLARTMQLERPATFDRLMKREGARLVMLGTPNGGSWAPMQVLSGDDTFGNALAALGSPLRDRQARQWMAEMPGFLQLQADLLDPKLGLDQHDTWAKLAADDLKQVQASNWWHQANGIEGEQPAYAWGVPPQGVLKQAKALRERLDKQRDGKLKDYTDRMLLVVGKAKFTPDGYEVGDEGFVYLNATDGGDGRVPLASALLPGVRTWTLDCEHGSLPDDSKAFEAYAELLNSGDTQRLDRLAPTGVGRGADARAAAPVAHVRSRPSRARPSAMPPATERQVFALNRDLQGTVDMPQQRPLRINVLNGNLSFVRTTLMVGHTRALTLTGTEAVANALIGGAMKASLDAGLYPDAPGSHQIFVNTRRDANNPWRAPQPGQVLVVGLGEEGGLTERGLSHTVRQGVIAWAQRMAEGGQNLGETVQLSATLIGSGSSAMNASNAARAIAQGVREANQRLSSAAAAQQGRSWPRVSELTLVELYLERASDAWNGLQVLAASAPGLFEVAPTIDSGVGPLRRQVDSGYRGTDYDFITATSTVNNTISFALDTKRARTEVRAQSTQGALLRELLEQASTASNQDPRLGRTLFQLLVPTEVEPFLAGTNRMLLELDDQTAPIPWELLDTRGEGGGHSDDRPWAIRTQLLRKLRQSEYRQQVQDAHPDDAVLVIGEPQVDPTQYGPLPGAKAEADAVVAALAGAGGLGADRVVALTNQDNASNVINALFERRYRIVHVAGHGEAVSRNDKGEVTCRGGVVLSDHTFLGPDEIHAMRTVPELVFVNCCHLAHRDTATALQSRPTFDRAAFASGVADSLIQIGVRCVIAAGWAVDDEPAKEFAETFYRELLNRQPFISAVAAAREAAWHADRNSNTWAAYQAYGDPNWVYRRGGLAETKSAPPPPREEFEGVSSPLGLALALEEQAVRSKWMHADGAYQLEKVRHLEARFGALWGGMGAVAEAFAVAYSEAGDSNTAIAWYERAMQSADSSASMKAQEQLGNLMARRGGRLARAARKGSPEMAQAQQDITVAIRILQSLAGLQPNMERHSLCGSAWKRQALLHRAQGNHAQEAAALEMSAQAYGAAEKLAQAAHDSNVFYPALNRMAVELALQIRQPAARRAAPESTLPMMRLLAERAKTEPDFWTFAAIMHIEMVDAIQARRLAAVRQDIESRFTDLHGRVSAQTLWGSVADNAILILEPYKDLVKGSEAAAAAGLLTLLGGYAKVEA